MTKVEVKIEFDTKFYDELKQALQYFSTVPIIDPQTHKFILDKQTGKPVTIVHSTKVPEFVKFGATKLVQEYKNPMVRQACDAQRARLKSIIAQVSDNSTK